MQVLVVVLVQLTILTLNKQVEHVKKFEHRAYIVFCAANGYQRAGRFREAPPTCWSVGLVCDCKPA